MATPYQLLSALGTAVNAVVQGLPAVGGGPLSVACALDWPPIKALQNAMSSGDAVIAVFDRKLVRNTTRWKPITVGQSMTTAGLTTAISANSFNDTATITLGGTVIAGDAVSCVLSLGIENDGVVVNSGTDPTNMATALAAAINAKAPMNTWVTASASGAVVTLATTPLGGNLELKLISAAGNGGWSLMEVGRRERQFQIVIWAATLEDRDTIVGTIDTMLASMQAQIYPYQAGLALADGTSGYVSTGSDYHLDDATLSDAYRHDFQLGVDYAVTTQDALYAVLAPILQYQIG